MCSFSSTPLGLAASAAITVTMVALLVSDLLRGE